MSAAEDGPTRAVTGPAPRRWLARGARGLLSVTLLAWLVLKIDVGAAAVLIRSVDRTLLGAAVLCVVGTLTLTCWRWRLCLLEAGSRVPFRAMAFSYWTALAVGTTLPTEYGGDVVRVNDMRDRTGSGSTAVASVFWSRLSGLSATLLIFAGVGVWRLERLRQLGAVLPWGLALAVLLTLAVAAVSRPVHRWIVASLERLPAPERLRRGMVDFLARSRAFATHPLYAWRVALLAMVSEILMLTANYLIVVSLGSRVDPVDLALVMPLVTLSTVLPISLGGLGVKEGAFVVTLAAVGLSREAALSVALLNRLVLLGLALSGALLFPFRQRLMGPLATGEPRR